jgi:hypothetical protein
MRTWTVARAFAMLLTLSSFAALPTVALAGEVGHPGWQITSADVPTDLVPGTEAAILLTPINVGAASSSGPVTVTDTLPPGVTATDAGTVETTTDFGTAELPDSFNTTGEIGHKFWECSIAQIEQNSVVTCHNNLTNMPSITGGAGVLAGAEGAVAQPPLAIAVKIAADASEGQYANKMTIGGGGAPSGYAAVDPLTIGGGTSAFGIAHSDGWFSNADGTLDNTAGSVPYSFTTTFDLNRSVQANGVYGVQRAGADLRTVAVALPPGLIGNPDEAVRCTRTNFEEEIHNNLACPRESIIGEVRIATAIANPIFPLFNIVPSPGQPALLGFRFEGVRVYIVPSIRTGGDYGITATASNLPAQEVIGSFITIWGVPNDPTHQPWRCGGAGCVPPNGSLGAHPALRPFLTMPTSCGAPDAVTTVASDWVTEPPVFTDPSSAFTHDEEGEPVGLEGCNHLPFEPTITSKPTTNVADSPTGLEFDLHIPQPENVKAIEGEIEGEVQTVGAEPEVHEADLKDAVVTLPKGISVNPSGANGLGACSPAQIGLTSAAGRSPVTMTPEPAECPADSKIGSVTIDTPLLDHPIEGGVYVATPEQNPSGSLLALYIAVDDKESGTVIKLPGKVEANPVTGQLTASFEETPQLPFEDFHLNFFGGATAALRTPSTCGEYSTSTAMTPWSTPEGATTHPGDSFEITQSLRGEACPTSEAALPNSPFLEAGTIAPKAGAFSPFVLHLARADGTQEISKIEATLPEGLLAKLAGVSECPDSAIAQAESRNKVGEGAAEAAHPSCPSSSEVGIVHVGAGAGITPYYVSGHAYLAGPYKGAPLSLVIVTPAVAGPYDLGTVVVRTSLKVDPFTAQVDAMSDPIPHILQGIPLDVRSISVELDRSQFTVNPTSCEKKTITGSATSLLGSNASLSVPFQVGECTALGFKPKLGIRLKGGTRRAGKPALTATLTMPAGANIAKARVGLPHSEFLDQGHIKTVCTQAELASQTCPAGAVYGHATAWSPLLAAPLEGPVYLGVGFGTRLPELVAELNGQIRVLAHAQIGTDKQKGIQATFEAVPDAPIEKFVLSMKGGSKSLIENSEDICAKTQKAAAAFTAQNGKLAEFKVPLEAKCPKGAHKKKGDGKKGHSRHGRH